MNGVERSNDGVVLKRCPFCDEDCLYETFEINDIGTTIPVIFCDSCKIIFKVENDSPYLEDDKTYEYLKEKNIKAWNNRKPPERVIERLDRELKIAKKEMEDCTFKGLPFYDTQNGYAKAMYKAIKIIEQELM